MKRGVLQRAALKRHPPARQTPETAAARRAFQLAVCAPRPGGACVLCRATDERPAAAYAADVRCLEAHHIIAQQQLKARGLHAHLWDVRNGLCLCRLHHQRVTDHHETIPRALLPAAVDDFAAEHHLEWLLHRSYR